MQTARRGRRYNPLARATPPSPSSSSSRSYSPYYPPPSPPIARATPPPPSRSYSPYYPPPSPNENQQQFIVPRNRLTKRQHEILNGYYSFFDSNLDVRPILDDLLHNHIINEMTLDALNRILSYDEQEGIVILILVNIKTPKAYERLYRVLRNSTEANVELSVLMEPGLDASRPPFTDLTSRTGNTLASSSL